MSQSAPHVPLWRRLGVTGTELEGLEPPSPRSFAPGVCTTPDGDPVLGLHYVTDFRTEEESGVGALRRTLTSPDPRRFSLAPSAKGRVGVFSDVNALVLSTDPLSSTSPAWGEALEGWGGAEYAEHFGSALPGVQGGPSDPLGSLGVPALRERARSLGVRPLPRRRRELEAAIRAVPAYEPLPERPESWPGWFSDGSHLVLRADPVPGRRNLSAHVLHALCAAAGAGTLALGSGSGAFATGLFLYDSRDETPGLVAEREAAFDWHDARLEELAPVEAELRRRGFSWFYLGNPRQGQDGMVRYWLNGSQGNGAQRQPYGWYTLQELLAERFVADANAPR